MIPARALARPRGASPAKSALVCIEKVHGAAGCSEFGAKQNFWAPAASASGFDIGKGSLEAARAVPRLPDHRQQHRRPQGGGVRAARSRRRSFPLERGVLHAVASEADRGIGRQGRDLDRSALRPEVRQDTAIPSMQLCIENGRSGRRLRLRLRLRLHRHDQLGVAGRAAADDSRSAHGVRPVVRRRRARRSSAPRRRDDKQHPRLGQRSDGGIAPAARRRAIALRLDRVPRQHPRDRTAHPEGRSAQPQRRSARAAGRAGRRAGRLRRTRQADVRSPGAGIHVGHDPGVLVQDRPRRIRTRLPGQRHRHRLPQRLASRPARRADPAVQRRSTATTCRCCPTSWRS